MRSIQYSTLSRPAPTPQLSTLVIRFFQNSVVQNYLLFLAFGVFLGLAIVVGIQ